MRIYAHCDSQLVAKQLNVEYDIKDERMEAYLKLARELTKDFINFKIINFKTQANALASLGSSLDSNLRRVISIKSIAKPSITLPKGIWGIANALDDHVDSMEAIPQQNDRAPTMDWHQELVAYIMSGEVSKDKWPARRAEDP